MRKFLVLIFVSFFTNATFAQVELICANTNATGNVELQWNVATPLCGVDFQSYEIFSSATANGPFTSTMVLITDEFANSFSDTNGVFDPTHLFFYIQTACTGAPLLSSDTLDVLSPETPIIDYVSVFGNFAQIFWFPGTSPETNSYIIYNIESFSGNQIVDTVQGQQTTTYLDLQATANLNPEEYTISAMDACLNAGPISDLTHQTVNLSTTNDSCSNLINVSWTHYRGWENANDNGIDRYDIYVANDGGSFQLIGNVNGTDSIFNYESFDAQDLVCVQVEAIRASDGQASLSNADCQTLQIATIASYIYPRRASFTLNNEMELDFYIDPNAGFEFYNFLNSTDSVNFGIISSEAMPNPIPDVLNHFEEGTDASQQGNYYSFSISDSCGIVYENSAIKAIILQTRPNVGFENELRWNAYEIENGFVNSYNVFRLNEDSTWLLLGNTASNDLTFFDFVGDVQNTTGAICYRVEAIYTLNHPLVASETLSAFSNTDCASQPAILYAPNAFAPNGINNEFRGILQNGNPDNFLMLIMNKWGEVIFETNDPNQGWNGQIGAKDAPAGTYAYYFRFSNFNGVEKEKKGQVLLLR